MSVIFGSNGLMVCPILACGTRQISSSIWKEKFNNMLQ